MSVTKISLVQLIDNYFKCNFIFVNMPHRIHKCTDTVYDYAIIINTYVSLMYELKKIGTVFTRKFVGTGPSSYRKIIYRAASSPGICHFSFLSIFH